MKRIAKSVIALALSTGLVLAGFGYGASALGSGAATNGGAAGCCRAAA